MRLNFINKPLSQHTDECIVISNNESLVNDGTHNYIYYLGSDELQEEIVQIPKNENGNRLNETESILTFGHNQQYQKIIHTLPPSFNDNKGVDCEGLEKCFDSIFNLVRENNIKSLTITPFGAGYYGFSYKKYYQICLSRALDELDKNNDLRITLLVDDSIASQ